MGVGGAAKQPTRNQKFAADAHQLYLGQLRKIADILSGMARDEATV